MPKSKYSTVGVNRPLFNEASSIARRNRIERDIGAALRLGLEGMNRNRLRNEELQTRAALAGELGMDPGVARNISSKDLNALLLSKRSDDAAADRMARSDARQQRAAIANALRERRWAQEDLVRSNAREDRAALQGREHDIALQEARDDASMDRTRMTQGAYNARELLSQLGQSFRTYLSGRNREGLVQTPAGQMVDPSSIPWRDRRKLFGYTDELSDREMERLLPIGRAVREAALRAGMTPQEVEAYGRGVETGMLEPDATLRDLNVQGRSSNMSMARAMEAYMEAMMIAEDYPDTAEGDSARATMQMLEGRYPQLREVAETAGAERALREARERAGGQ